MGKRERPSDYTWTARSTTLPERKGSARERITRDDAWFEYWVPGMLVGAALGGLIMRLVS